jgi:hypothetical protein
MLASSLVSVEVVVPYDRYDLVTQAYETGTVLLREETPEGVRLRASVPLSLGEKLAGFAAEGREG